MTKKKQLLYTTASGYPGDGEWIEKAYFTRHSHKADIIIFEGGTDISPSIYNEPRGKYTQVSGLTERDKKEIELFNYGIRHNKFLVGICRGGQLLTALNGGKLIQHVNNHGSSRHAVKTWDNKTYNMNSLHHQMFYPWDLPKEDYKLISWTEGISTTYLNGWDDEISFPNDAITEEGLIIEPEVVFYPKTKSFSVQGHPEFLGYRGWGWNLEGNDNDVHTLDYLNNLINILYYEPNYFKNLITEKINN